MLTYIPALALICVILLLFVLHRAVLHMPGGNYRGPLPPLTDREKHHEEKLREILVMLCDQIGERNLERASRPLQNCAVFLERQLRACGCEVNRQEFEAVRRIVCNIEGVFKGADAALPPLVIGAHYDTVPFSPGANDNGSAVAAALCIAHAMGGTRPRRTLRFVFFVNEEMPYYMTDAMGSLHYAKACRARGEELMGAIILETIGYYTDAPESQKYPRVLAPFFPRKGNFIGFVGDMQSRRFTRTVIRAFRRRTLFPSEGVAAPHQIRDILRSDNAAFWTQGYPAVMVTDTANFRYPYYHTPEDTLDKINLPCLARVTHGLERVVRELAGMPE